MTEEANRGEDVQDEVRGMLRQALALLDDNDGPLDLRARLADLIELIGGEDDA